MRIRLLLASLSLFCLTQNGFASHFPSYGLSFSHTAISKDPTNVQGYRAGIWYQPKSLMWQHVHILFDASFGHWWVGGHNPNRSLSIYSVAPILRYYWMENSRFSPFLNASLGVAYLTKTRLDDRNLGMHFSFQDQLGVGFSLGETHQFSVIFNAIHYSNGSLCGTNAGITVPLMISAEYGFG